MHLSGQHAACLCLALGMCCNLYSIMVCVRHTLALLCMVCMLSGHTGAEPLIFLQRLCCHAGCSPVCHCGWRLPQADLEAQHSHLPGDSRCCTHKPAICKSQLSFNFYGYLQVHELITQAAQLVLSTCSFCTTCLASGHCMGATPPASFFRQR